MRMRRAFITAFAAAATAAGASSLVLPPAHAHHGWSWTQPETFEISGEITEVFIGNPHGTLDVDVDGEIWRVELAPPGRTRSAGLTEEIATAGTQVTAIGNRSQDESERRMKAVRIVIDGTNYDVYPGRAAEI